MTRSCSNPRLLMRIAVHALHVGHTTWIVSGVIGCERVYSYKPALDEKKSARLPLL